MSTKQSFRWDFLSAFIGIPALIMAFIPYLSLPGVLMAFVSMYFAVRAFQHKQKSPWVWLGLITAALTILALLAVGGLIIFF